MSDLIKFLRTSTSSAYNKVAADCIEELEKQCSLYARSDQFLVEEIKELEAKLTEAVESIKQSIKLWEKPDGGDRLGKLDNAYDGFELLCAALAELEGKE